MGKTELWFQISFLSTLTASCVSSETHKHGMANVGFDLTCLKERLLLPIYHWGEIVPLCCKRVTLFPLSRNDPSPAGNPGHAVAWIVVLFSQEQDRQGQFLCHLPHYKPELSKVVAWKIKFSHCNKHLPLTVKQDKNQVPIKELKNHTWGKQFLMNLEQS